MRNPMIICDFDGTITESDNIIAIMNKFAPAGWKAIKDQIFLKEVSIQDGVGKMFSLLSSDLKENIIDYLNQNSRFREGFTEFLTFVKKNQIPFYVVSGGIDFFVYKLLEDHLDPSEIYCNQAEFSGGNIQIQWPYSCDQQCSNQGCGCCKPSVIRRMNTEDYEVIVIGDSITDLEAAKCADYIFARDFLAEQCDKLALPYSRFETFFDCKSELEKSLGVKK
ncbi:2-hydroxy-3-keto-5-methylthiopentenyl-1-phosphate phosphatase [Bacillus pakistanensis]|uniref:2-hydroxy-3-keto-5-methylthiopentenyl-1-phosphate phosphatase n=1 Tax=Rossellomorea pakistanensis TaxID=992288 RepID=A0ABS2NFH7_9BACI|nr:2-hydroxy-3-keto-5-methylthiopentenyl-1-phosphate phosphatase [Bacillus pakistanensis]MBM7586610.1 2-hydroxy-3-keto-5-methylthiopentenyl-1-phosphate phosphatase [Bacillus pakistanensis]